jgi:hypothetical protein
MDAFDYKDEITPSRGPADLVLNVISAVALIGALCVGVVFLVIFFNPQSGINPFPPPTLPALAQFPTPTPTPQNVLPPTWTPTPTTAPSDTPEPSATPLPTDTPTQEPPVEQATPTEGTPPPTVESAGMAYEIQQGDPSYIKNIGHPDLGCNWMGVAGQATGMNGAPVVGLFVQLGGTLQGQPLERLSMTGTATGYGSGGYEFTLGDKPMASTDTFWVQLFDQGMLPLSDKVPFSTFDDCEKNLVLVNFRQVR